MPVGTTQARSAARSGHAPSAPSCPKAAAMRTPGRRRCRIPGVRDALVGVRGSFCPQWAPSILARSLHCKPHVAAALVLGMLPGYRSGMLLGYHLGMLWGYHSGMLLAPAQPSPCRGSDVMLQGPARDSHVPNRSLCRRDEEEPLVSALQRPRLLGGCPRREWEGVNGARICRTPLPGPIRVPARCLNAPLKG